jgi:hypothetical protein
MSEPTRNSRKARKKPAFAVATGAAMTLALMLLRGPAVRAADTKAAAAALSNQAFALLNSLSAPAEADPDTNSAAKALIGPVASFAGDAQSLSQALGAGNQGAARNAAASLNTDAESVDDALKAHAGAVKPEQWNSLKAQLAAIEKTVPPVPATASSVPASAGGPPTSPPPSAPSMPPAAASSAGGPSVTASGAPGRSSDNAGPIVKIESHHTVGDVTRIKGYFEGSGLKSAGIYEGDQNVKPIKVDAVPGDQKVDFELALRNADISTNVRVVDQLGRTATASVFGDESIASAGNRRESGIEVDRSTGASPGTNTAEIPSANASEGGELGEVEPDEDLGGGLGGGLSGRPGSPMGNVQVNIESVSPVSPLSHMYQVAGQIIGSGVHHAGIYVDGRLVKRIPVSRGAQVTNFHTKFIMNGGTATIRAFGSGNQYVESSIQTPPAVASSPPIVVAPYGMNPYGGYGMNPYAGDPFGNMYGTPFGSPYGSPFGAPSYGYNISPYGITRYPVSPYGSAPYGAAPFGVNPYAAPINPYGNARPMGPAGR